MNTKSLQAKLENIVRGRYPEIETLETRCSDDLDFHEVSVWGLKELLEAAYRLGVQNAPTPKASLQEDGDALVDSPREIMQRRKAEIDTLEHELKRLQAEYQELDNMI